MDRRRSSSQLSRISVRASVRVRFVRYGRTRQVQTGSDSSDKGFQTRAGAGYGAARASGGAGDRQRGSWYG